MPADPPKPIDLVQARAAHRRLAMILDSVPFQAPEVLPTLKHRAAVEIDKFAEAMGLVLRSEKGK